MRDIKENYEYQDNYINKDNNYYSYSDSNQPKDSGLVDKNAYYNPKNLIYDIAKKNINLYKIPLIFYKINFIFF
jgi:hypothetical protein